MGCFFCFKAEDGIRDDLVTGVQTCALPIFPSTVGDSYGPKFAATNAGLLYTAKGTASLLVPFTSVITTATGSWHMVFYIAAAMNAVAAVLALLLLKPIRTRMTRADATKPP